MNRAEWLKQMRRKAESLYDHISPLYWVSFGFYENATHMDFLRRFLARVAPGGAVLSAGCGAGRYDGFLLDAGHAVTGVDQSEGMLAKAREHFPQVRYEKIGLQELPFREAFDGVICIDALEHVCPEDYLGVLRKFAEALKPGGMLYFTVDASASPEDLAASYARSQEQGLPVVPGEVVDRVDLAYDQVQSLEQVPGALSDAAVYHYYPSLVQVREWLAAAELKIEEEGAGSGYHHFLARKG